MEKICTLLLRTVLLPNLSRWTERSSTLSSEIASTSLLWTNSDNVLRGGLTSKHVNLPELMATLSFEHGPVGPLKAERFAAGERRYPTPAEEFALSVLQVAPQRAYACVMDRAVEILLCTAGQCRLSANSGESSLELRRGESALLPAALGGYRVEGEAQIFRAQVGGGTRTTV